MHRPSQPTVLIVEGDGALRLLMTDFLEARGFAVAQTHDADDAMSRLEGFAYDGMVVEAGLGAASGLEVLDAALTRYPEMRAVVLAGQRGVEDAVRAIKLGAIDFLVRPFPLEQLAQVLHVAISERRQRAEGNPQPVRSAGRFSCAGVIGQSARPTRTCCR